MSASSVHFRCEPHPGYPGWHSYEVGDADQYNRVVLGELIIRAEDDGHCRVRLFPDRHHANVSGRIHGGVTLGLIDVALFGAMYLLRGGPVAGSVTLDIQNQFVGAGDVGRPLDALVEVLRETHRMVFLRGLVVQEEDLVSSFTGIIRKAHAG